MPWWAPAVSCHACPAHPSTSTPTTHPTGTQVLPNGSRRPRGLPLSEKLLPGERWQEAVVRGVVEELGPVLPENPQVGTVQLLRCTARGWGRVHGEHSAERDAGGRYNDMPCCIA